MRYGVHYASAMRDILGSRKEIAVLVYAFLVIKFRANGYLCLIYEEGERRKH